MTARRGLAAVLLAGATAAATPVAACGPFPIVARFWHESFPGVTFEQSLDGELGILAEGHQLLDLFVAYRHLAGLGIGAARDDLLALRRPSAGDSAAEAAASWREARRRVPGAEEIPPISTTRREVIDEDGHRRYLHFENCLADAFRTAARTLEERIGAFGADAPVVREWLSAQDLVFRNCRDGRFVPEPLTAPRPSLARADREYQIAAAWLYSRGYAEAEQRFRAIAADPGSPWSELSHYLVARAMARDGRKARALEYLEALLADPARAPVHGMAKGYRDHLFFLFHPAERHRETRHTLAAPELPAAVAQTWVDFSWSLGVVPPDEHALDLWLCALRRPVYSAPAQDPDPAALVRARRTAEGGALWRTAALLTARPDDPEFDAVLADAATVPLPGPPSAPPEALTVAYHRARLLHASGRDAEARGVVDALLAHAERLAPGDRNRVLVLASRLAEDRETYLRRVILAPIEVGYDDGGFVIPRADLAPSGVLLLHDEAVRLLNRLAAAELAEVAASAVLTRDLRAYLTGVAWSRAALLGDPATAEASADRLAELFPGLREDLTAWRDAAPEEREFVTALVSLRHPGLHPDVHLQLGQVDGLDGGWWCQGSSFPVDPEAPLPSFVEPGDERRAATAALVVLPSAPIHLGGMALRHAARRPDDPRLPEALHRVVRATRYGCDRGTYGEISRAAFERLHRDFSHSPWTQKTPYWFN
ncbi:MAG TPA: hypothetical protein VGG06_32080 [Thermoanaerobaculia bacterium]